MSSSNPPIDGGCLCGTIRYQADRPPFEAGYCHCRMCQKALGNLFGAWVFFHHDGFRWMTEPAWYRSSPLAKRGFCRSCGSPIAYQNCDVDFIAIWIGTLDDPSAFEPSAHWWTGSKIAWVDIHSNLPDKGTVFHAND